LPSSPGKEIGLGWFGAFFAFLHAARLPEMVLRLGLIAFAAGMGVVLGGLASRRFGGQGSAEARRQWSRRLADASFDGLLVHRSGTILQMNRALVRMLGYREMELLGTHFSNIAHPAQVAALRTELEAPQPQLARFTLLQADRSECFVEMASHTLELDGLPATVTAIRDLTAMRAIETRLAFLMHNDVLTGLANAAMFTEKLQEAVARNDASGGTTAVLTLKLEQLKAVNEQLGRGGGDILLRQIANRLQAMTDERDTVARLGGNQFGILQPHGGAPNRCALLISQIESAMEEPFIVEGKAIRASMAIGGATYPEHATGAEGLLNASGFALSKAIEKGGTHMFSHAEAAAAGFGSLLAKGNTGGRMLSLEEQRLAHDLRLAIPRGEIWLEYQPVFGSRFLNLAGYEALARWRHPKDGSVPPKQFIALADDAGLAIALGNFILETACAEAIRGKGQLMAIHLSPMQFRDPLLPGRIQDALQKTALPANRLEVQVTEAMLLENPAASSQMLRAIRNIGVVLTLDDFGTGFALLSNMADFPFSRLKIDKRFIQRIGEDGSARSIVLAILSLARSLDIEVTAEGIETEAQLNFLQQQDCSFVQGYLLGRPAAQASPQAAAGLAAAAPQVSALLAASPVAASPIAGGASQASAIKPSLVMTQR
jgi:diguanylate cyclase (GGDEF)-like protein/PAS domain S-box-containing protein